MVRFEQVELAHDAARREVGDVVLEAAAQQFVAFGTQADAPQAAFQPIVQFAPGHRQAQGSGMSLMTFEHRERTYGVDFGLYGLAVAALAAWIVAHGTAAQALPLAALVGLGLAGWSLLEYLLQHWPGHSRWLRRRKRWHGLHHHHRQPGRYGVTTSFWGRVFSTGASSRPITESRLP